MQWAHEHVISKTLPMKLICQWHCLAYHPWALWELINACKSPWELQRKDALCMQSPAAFPWCLLHTCAHCIMCRLCLVAECLLCTYGLSMIDGWIRVPTLEALPCQQGACPHMSVHHQPLSSGTVVRFPKTMITLPQKQTSILTPFLAVALWQEASLSGVSSLPPRALVKLHSFMFLKYVKRTT